MNRLVRATIEALIEARNERGGKGVPKKLNGSKIRSLRQSLSMTQREFADAFGFDFESVKSWEQDRRHPDPVNSVLLELIAKDPVTIQEMVSESTRSLEFA